MQISKSPRALFQVFKQEIANHAQFDFKGDTHVMSIGDQVALTTVKDFDVKVRPEVVSAQTQEDFVDVTIGDGSFVDTMTDTVDVIYLSRGGENFRLTENLDPGYGESNYELHRYDGEKKWGDKWVDAESLSFKS